MIGVNFLLWTALIALAGVYLTEAVADLKCTDWRGIEIENGLQFEPKEEDPCFKCTCSDGYPTMCRSVTCKPSSCKNYILKPGYCCKFECLDDNDGDLPNSTIPRTPDDGNGGNNNDNVTTLGLRLIASTVTSFLVLALLLFMVHRLRQKRVMMAMRRYRNSRQERLDEVDADTFAPEFLGIECPPYEDPPPPYTPPKPPSQVLPSEAPPPYEAVDSNQTSNAGGSSSSNNNNTVPYTSSTEHQCRYDQACINNPALPVLESLRANQNHLYESRHSTSPYPHLDTFSSTGRSCAITENDGRAPDALNNGSYARNDALVQIDTRQNTQRVNFVNSPRFSMEDPVRGMSTFHPRRSQGRVRERDRRAASYHGNPRDGRNGRGDLERQQQTLDGNLEFDLDLWDETSTATSSEYPASSCANTRRYILDDSTDSSQQFHFMEPFLRGTFDPEDVSTETSCSSRVTAHNRYSSLPSDRAVMQGCPTHVRSLSQDSQVNRMSDDHRGTSKGAPDSYQQRGLQCFDEDGKNTEEPSMDCNFSVSNISTDNRNISSSQTGAQASITNCLENDSVLAAEDKNRKLEQIFDSQKLRILRLSKLLQNPCENHVEGSECPHPSTCNQDDMPRSHSVTSGMSLCSVCSETGEKKLSRMTSLAIGNDAQYPENAYGGRLPLTVFDPECDAVESVSGSAVVPQTNQNLHTVVNSQILLNSRESDNFSQNSCDRGENGVMFNPRLSEPIGSTERFEPVKSTERHRNSKYNDKEMSAIESPRSDVNGALTREKLVQTDKKLASKSKSLNKGKVNHGSTEQPRKKKHENSKTLSRVHNSTEDSNRHNSTTPRVRDASSSAHRSFIDELKLLNQSRNRNTEISCAQYSENSSMNNENFEGDSAPTVHPYHMGKRHSASKSNLISRSSSQSSHKSSQSSSAGSNGESNLLCPTSMGFSKKKLKNSKRAKHRKSHDHGTKNKNSEPVPVIVGMDTGLEIYHKGLKDHASKENEPRKYSLV